MLNRTIPFYNMILRCDRYEKQKIFLRDGFKIVSYRTGDEKAWAKLEYDIGDFNSTEEAEQYFVSNYLRDKRLYSNILFLLNSEKCVVGSCIAWKDKQNASAVSSLHWLVVNKANQGNGLGRALCTAVMNLFAERKEFPIYIHTQPWSWKAILLYIFVGFQIQKEDTFSHYENQFEQAIDTLRNVVSRDQFELIKNSVRKY